MDCIGFSRFGTGRHGRWLVALLLYFLGWTLSAAPPAAPGRVTPPAPRPAPDGHRFLFVVDISAGMRTTDLANRQALFEMLFTGLDGQMRKGDTFGLWFYNDKLHAGEFPMQIWDDKDPLPVATLATKFLREQQYSGKSRPEVLMPKLLNLIKGVGDVNVLVISQGKPALKGTPFDTNIAALIKRKSTERESAQKPFVTALVARGGTIINGAVIIPGEELRFPERPPPVLAAKATNSPAKPRIATTTPKSEPVIRNVEPPPTVAAVTTQPTPLPPKVKVFEFATRTNDDVTNKVVVSATTQKSSIPGPDFSKLGSDSRISIAELFNPGFEPLIVSTQSEIVTAKSEPITRNPEPQQPAVSDPAPATPVKSFVATLSQALDAEPIPVAARSPAAPGQTATAPAVLAVTSGPSAMLLLTIGIVLLAACFGLLVLVLRRLRPRDHTSFITRSMELR